MKKRFLALMMACCLFLPGCVKWVDYYTSYNFQGLEEFYWFHSDNKDQEELIKNGDIEFAKLGDVYVCPFIKDVTHEECGLFFYVYSLKMPKTQSLKITNVVLKDGKDTVLFESSNEYDIVLEYTEDDIQVGYLNVVDFVRSDDWCYDGGALTLSFQASADLAESKDYSYDVVIDIQKEPEFLTIT